MGGWDLGMGIIICCEFYRPICWQGWLTLVAGTYIGVSVVLGRVIILAPVLLFSSYCILLCNYYNYKYEHAHNRHTQGREGWSNLICSCSHYYALIINLIYCYYHILCRHYVQVSTKTLFPYFWSIAWKLCRKYVKPSTKQPKWTTLCPIPNISVSYLP